MARVSFQWKGLALITFVPILIFTCDAGLLRESTPIAIDRRVNGDPLPKLDEIILTETDLTTMASAFEAAGLVGKLSTSFNYTIFAPNNDAFEAFDQTFLKTLLTPSWTLHLQNLLAFHVTLPTDGGNRLLSTDFIDEQMFEMLNSEQVTATVLTRGISLNSPLTNNSMIVAADLLASNGALHKVGTVFSPGYFGVDAFSLGKSYVEFSILQELMDILGLAGTKGEFTILAPTNEAFLALGNDTLAALKEDTEALGKILANHLIVGVFPTIFLEDGLVLQTLGGLNVTVTVSMVTVQQPTTAITFNDANVIVADILAINGVGHAIDMVLIDPDLMSDVPSSMPSDTPSAIPSEVPSSIPSGVPSDVPSQTPSSTPSQVPSSVPSSVPSNFPSGAPSNLPSDTPSDLPSDSPSNAPSDVPSDAPSDQPSAMPSESPSFAPSSSPSDAPRRKGMTKNVKSKMK
jgi:uncharacterized surface protein with fasciclin (FAS1) repeats